MNLLSYTLFVIGAYISLYVFYDLILLFAHFLIKERGVLFHSPETRFGVIIPAHNEELLLSRVLQSVNNQDYPRSLFRYIVIADNCTDKTAEVAIANGALALRREDLQHVGKGYAIKFALESIDMDQYDAIFIVDADSVIKNDLLIQLDTALRRGQKIIQCYNGVANPDQSWFTRLLDVSRTIGNEIYHPAKHKLGLSSYLMGNGMCFSRSILLKYGWNAFSVGEDWEYYAKLIQAGEMIAFSNKARVFHQESSSLKQATSQRMRWSSGRFAVAWKYGSNLFCKGVLERDIKIIDASLPLIFPNPSLGINITMIGLILSFVLTVEKSQHDFILWFSSLALTQLLIFLVGILYTRNKWKNFLALFVAPLFLIWKMGIDLFSAMGMGKKRWIRTERKL
jgi:cellulose synthase/poly-beta-1,6-N-acetylglucosamine synthase-like glycosyltransferase